jgi:hypothetical protein
MQVNALSQDLSFYRNALREGIFYISRDSRSQR